MSDYATQSALLADAKRHLLRMREEISLSETEALVVSRGIAAIERFTDLGNPRHEWGRP